MEEMGLLIARDEQIYPDACGAQELQSQMQQPSDPNESEQIRFIWNHLLMRSDTICTNWEKQVGVTLLFGGDRERKAVYMEVIAHG